MMGLIVVVILVFLLYYVCKGIKERHRQDKATPLLNSTNRRTAGTQGGWLTAEPSSWFFIIAVLSVVNSIIVLTGSHWNFIVGLGTTQVIDGIIAGVTKESTGVGAGVFAAIALMINVIIAGIYVALGIFARKRHNWAYITGMVLYGLDGVIFLFVAAWLNVAFHGFILFSLFNGIKVCKQSGAMEKIV
jgi:zinc transporter ZupT